MPMPKRRAEPLLRGGPDLEMGYVGDQEAIPAYNSTAPWQAGRPHLKAIGEVFVQYVFVCRTCCFRSLLPTLDAADHC